MSSLVERLRYHASDLGAHAVACREAADRIETLETNVVSLQATLQGAEVIMRRALDFYGAEAEALARYMVDGNKADAILASVTVLSLDGGRRARAALDKDASE
jgi:hypothetical protein